MGVLISAVLPIALVVLVGGALGRYFKLDIRTLAQVNIYGMLPALIFTSLADMAIVADRAIAMIAAYLITTLLLYLIALGLSRGLHYSADEQKSLIAASLFANVGNMGLPFILFSLGEAGLERAVLYLITASLMITSIFPIILKGTGLISGVRYALKLPVFWAALLGVGIQLLGLPLPEAIARSATLLGNGVIPLALLTLGIQLSCWPQADTSFVRLLIGPYEILGSGMRLVVAPLLAFGVGRVLGLMGLDLQVLVLQSAMPVAVSSVIWVSELGGDAQRLSRTIVLSTALSLLTLPLVLQFSVG